MIILYNCNALFTSCAEMLAIFNHKINSYSSQNKTFSIPIYFLTLNLPLTQNFLHSFDFQNTSFFMIYKAEMRI